MSTVNAIASWFGTNRSLAHEVGKSLEGCNWVGVVFAGGMCEIPHITARTLMVNDLHKHLINLSRVAADPVLGPKLYRRLRRHAFHPDALEGAQDYCRRVEAVSGESPERTMLFSDPYHVPDPLTWAECYFISAWMSRHGSAGTKSEFDTGISTRWNANGGDSAAHFHGAVRSLVGWRKTLRRANFTCLDFREFLKKCKDEPGIGVYVDPPFPGPGDGYKHAFADKDHRDLANLLNGYSNSRIVARFYEHPMVRELYPEPGWTWRKLTGGKRQTNEAAPEVLLVRN